LFLQLQEKEAELQQEAERLEVRSSSSSAPYQLNCPISYNAFSFPFVELEDRAAAARGERGNKAGRGKADYVHKKERCHCRCKDTGQKN
jgi:hypothetical protein